MIAIFKTSVPNKKSVQKIKPLLNEVLPSSKWNFDLKDCDHILRVESTEITTTKVIEALKSRGFECIELD